MPIFYRIMFFIMILRTKGHFLESSCIWILKGCISSVIPSGGHFAPITL